MDVVSIIKKDMLTALDICNFINKFHLNINYNIIGSETQFDIALQIFLKTSDKYFICIINYNYHWVYLIIIRSKDYFKILFYDSLGNNIKENYYKIIIKRIKIFIFLFNTKHQQISKNTCGIYVIVLFFLVFSLINKNVNSINKINYIIENYNISTLVELLKKYEFNT